MSERLPAGGIEVRSTELDARWSAAWTPQEVAQRLAGVETTWYVAAGWALELFHGTKTREHGDIEIAIPAAHFPEIRDRFPGYAFDAVGSGQIWESAGPRALAATRQTWLRDPATGNYLLDVFREPHDGGTWICRRDTRIRMPYGDIIRHTPGGIPYLTPELVLLFKAKDVRSKDQADFTSTLPQLTPDQRGTLAKLLGQVHPGHAWLKDL